MQPSIQIIGISGTNGAGKDTIGQYLADQYGYLFISVTELLRNECRRRHLPVERENLRTISAEWRRELGLGVLVDKAVAQFEAHKDTYRGVVMASLRNPGEADRLHEFHGTLLWVDADPKMRYDRIQANLSNRGKVEEDRKTYEQFLAEEQAEMHSSGDEATLDMSRVKEKADVTIMNDKPDVADLFRLLIDTLGLSVHDQA